MASTEELHWTGSVNESAAPTSFDLSEDYVFLGRSLGRDVIVSVADLLRHMWITGQTRSGKSALLTGLTNQLLHIAGEKRHLSVIVSDHKGSPAQLYDFLLTCKIAGVRPVVLTTMPGLFTHAFNPLQQRYLKTQSPVTKAEYLTEALGLRVSSVGEAAFWGAVNEHPLILALEEDIRDFEELEGVVMSGAGWDNKYTQHLQTALNKIKRVPFLNSDSSVTPQGQLQLDDLFNEPIGLYLYLPTSLSPDLNYSIVRFVMSGVQLATQFRPVGTRNSVLLIIDEAAKIASKSLDNYLDQAAGNGLGVILAHQHVHQLKTSDHDHYYSFLAGGGIRMSFTPWLNPEQFAKYGQTTVDKRFSGSTTHNESITTKDDGGWSQSAGQSETHGWQEYEHPGHEINDLREVSEIPNRCLFDTNFRTKPFNIGGFPFAMDCFFHIPKEVHEAREKIQPLAKPFAPGMIQNPGFGVSTDSGPVVSGEKPAEVEPEDDTSLAEEEPSETWKRLSAKARAWHESLHSES